MIGEKHSGAELLALLAVKTREALGDGDRPWPYQRWIKHGQACLEWAPSMNALMSLADPDTDSSAGSLWFLAQYCPDLDRSRQPIGAKQLAGLIQDSPRRRESPDDERDYVGWREYIGSEDWIRDCRAIRDRMKIVKPDTKVIVRGAKLKEIVEHTCDVLGYKDLSELAIAAGLGQEAIEALIAGKESRHDRVRLTKLAAKLLIPETDTAIRTLNKLIELTRPSEPDNPPATGKKRGRAP